MGRQTAKEWHELPERMQWWGSAIAPRLAKQPSDTKMAAELDESDLRATAVGQAHHDALCTSAHVAASGSEWEADPRMSPGIVPSTLSLIRAT